MSAKKRVPKLRFRGFSGEWEDQKIEDISEIIGGGTPSTSIAEYWDGEIDWYSPTEIGNKTYADGSVKKITLLGLEKSSARVLPANKTILFTSRAGIGSVAILRKDGTTNQGFQSFIVKSDNDTYFMYSLSNKIKEYALKIASGSTFLEISGKQLSKISVCIPKKEEQTKIGNYFQNLDKLIEQKEKKYQKLGQLKKAMLEKMFPKEGATTPEIRFKGFSGEWEEKRIEEIVDVIDGDRGHNYPNGDELQTIGHTLFLSASNVTVNGFKFVNNQYITELKSESMGNGKLIENDIVLTSRGSIGHIAWYNKEIMQQVSYMRINSGMLILRTLGLINSSILTQLLKSPLGKKKIDLISFGSAQPQLTKKDVSNNELIFPLSKLEQTKIGNYFQKLDYLIELQDQELQKLKNIKKASLAKMFV